MPLIQLREQHPGDELDHAVAFGEWLDSGDELATQAVVAASGLTLGSGAKAAAISGDDVVFWVSGGTTGTIYAVEVTVTTTGGRTRVVDCEIAVTDPTP
jgi:ssDNA-binding replication factor A large subunit